MPEQNIFNKLISSLADLTKVRESFVLDDALLAVVQDWFNLVTSQSVTLRMRVMRKRELVTMTNYLKVKSNPNALDWTRDVYGNLVTYFSSEARHYRCLPMRDSQLHIFPLHTSLFYKQAVLLVEYPALSQETVTLLEQCLLMFHYYASLIIENERDALTGLLNRKTFDQSVSKILLNGFGKAASQGRQHFLAIFDIDFFKRINDTYGHLIGDEVLLLLSRLMQETFREGDLLFRFGGEEFVGVFSCVDEADVLVLLQRFMNVLATFVFPQVGKVTVSIGCAKMSVDVLPNTVLERADEALYFAKEHGRDQICSYEELLANGLLDDTLIQGEIELF